MSYKFTSTIHLIGFYRVSSNLSLSIRLGPTLWYGKSIHPRCHAVGSNPGPQGYEMKLLTNRPNLLPQNVKNALQKKRLVKFTIKITSGSSILDGAPLLSKYILYCKSPP